MHPTTVDKSSSNTGPENSGSIIEPSYTLNNYYALKYYSNKATSFSDLPVYFKYYRVY
jgi:hypothetical protein